MNVLEMPFKHVPVLVDGNFTLAQMIAIMRYLAKKHGEKKFNSVSMDSECQSPRNQKVNNPFFVKTEGNFKNKKTGKLYFGTHKQLTFYAQK